MKYRLIEMYPGSPELGAVVTLDGQKGYYIRDTIITGRMSVPIDHVENNPIFWQKVEGEVFTTEDEVDIFVGQNFYYIGMMGNIIEETATKLNVHYTPKKKFSTRDAAMDYLISSKVCICLNDIKGMLTLTQKEQIIAFVKDKIEKGE